MAIINTKSYGVARGTSSGSSSSGSSRSSSVSYTNTDYAEEAGHAKKADEADYADEAGYAKKAAYASSAGSLASSAGGFLSAEDDDIAEGTIVFSKGIYIGDGAIDEDESEDEDEDEDDDDSGVDYSGCAYGFSSDGVVTANKLVTETSLYDTDGNDLIQSQYTTVYRIIPSTYVIGIDSDGNCTPSSVSFSVIKANGSDYTTIDEDSADDEGLSMSITTYGSNTGLSLGWSATPTSSTTRIVATLSWNGVQVDTITIYAVNTEAAESSSSASVTATTCRILPSNPVVTISDGTPSPETLSFKVAVNTSDSAYNVTSESELEELGYYATVSCISTGTGEATNGDLDTALDMSSNSSYVGVLAELYRSDDDIVIDQYYVPIQTLS